VGAILVEYLDIYRWEIAERAEHAAAEQTIEVCLLVSAGLECVQLCVKRGLFGWINVIWAQASYLYAEGFLHPPPRRPDFERSLWFRRSRWWLGLHADLEPGGVAGGRAA